MSENKMKHGTLARLQKVADPYGVTVFREGAQQCLKIRKGEQSRVVIDMDSNQVPSGLRQRTYEQWIKIIKENAEALVNDE